LPRAGESLTTQRSARSLALRTPRPRWSPAGPCPDLRTFAAFVEGLLPRTDVEGLADHVAECPKCLDGLKKAAAMVLRVVTLVDGIELPPTVTARHANRRALAGAALGVAFGAAAAMGTALALRWRPAVEDRGVVLTSTAAPEPPYSSAAEPDSPPLLDDAAAPLLAREESNRTVDRADDPTPLREKRDADVVAALEVIERALGSPRRGPRRRSAPPGTTSPSAAAPAVRRSPSNP
jgi:hypothetical protein